MSTRTTRRLLAVVFVWAALYLPWLGTSGLRSEEGHRVLPAVEMLESGNFLVPHIGGEPYLRKPPLINWLVAASFKLSGQRNEWTARLPSILSVLALALGFVVLTHHSLGGRGALLAALACLTSLGLLEKGRMIEIEALYVALFGLGFLCWITWWRAGRSPWLVWTVPWIFLGFGLLAKGPTHLLFFYALVFAVLWESGRVRELWHPAHLFGLALVLGIFACWAIPYSQALRAETISRTWSSELLNRFTGSEGTLNDWLLNFPLALGYFLPAGLLLPFVRFRKMESEERKIARGLFWGAALPFVVVLLLPGAIQRYVLPTLVPTYYLLGMAIKCDAFEWRLFRRPVPARMVYALVFLIALAAAIIFPLRSATVQKERPGFDKVAAPINQHLAPGEALYAIDPRFQPYLFYIRARVIYLESLNELPRGARHFIVRPKVQGAVEKWGHANGLEPRLILKTQSLRGQSTLFYEIASP